MRRLLFILLLILPIFVASFVIYRQSRLQSEKTNIEGVTVINKGVNVSAVIGGGEGTVPGGPPVPGEPREPGPGVVHKFVLYGYTSPSAQVFLDGIGIISETTADKTGYFSFDNSISPILPREACLTVKDQLGRLSSPTCLPSFPTSYDVTIGPVLLPPTLALNKPLYYTGEEIILAGQTMPSADVILSLFVDPSKSSIIDYLSWINPVKEVEAFTFSDLKTKSDSKGNFSLKIPSAKSDLFRLLARSLYDNQSTPQSTRLSLKILPIWWMLFYSILLWLWHLIQPHLLEIIILIQIVVLVAYLIRQHLRPHALASQRALMVEEEHSLAVLEEK